MSLMQEHGKDDVTGQTLVRRDDDQPEVSYDSYIWTFQSRAYVGKLYFHVAAASVCSEGNEFIALVISSFELHVSM